MEKIFTGKESGIDGKGLKFTLVGAGIVGLAAGLALQQAGYRVTILDREGVAAGASWGNAGYFAIEQVFPLADPALLPKLPGMLLDPQGPFRIRPQYLLRALPWFCRFLLNMLPSRRAHNGAALRVLNERSMAAATELVRFCDCEELLVVKGGLLVFEGDALSVAEREFRAYQDAGVAVRLLDGEQVRTLEPALSTGIRHGLYFTDAGHTPDPYRLCHALADKFIECGGELQIGTLKAIETSSGLRLQLADGRSLSSDKLLISTGAWSKPLVGQLGHRVPLETERGYHLMMPQHSGLQRPVASFERKFIITPMAAGTRLAGTVEFGGLEAAMSPERADCLLPHAKALLPGIFADAKASQGQRWMGFRPSLPDSLPVLGKTAARDVYVSFGHQHLGLTWAAITARLLGQMVEGVPTEVDMAPYRIDRF
jgi:D-hydroxyproline dehydrogenase